MEIMGQTIDDAAGEAFDKSAKIMGLPYPGGPMIDKLAADGDPSRFTFAKPQIPGLDFSFSGLKTSILYFIRDELKKDPGFIEKNKADLCASIQSSIIDILLDKLKKAVGSRLFSNNTCHVPTIKNHLTDKKKLRKKICCN
jgi:N6-L-threonylcarbamoyladenine synthase